MIIPEDYRAFALDLFKRAIDECGKKDEELTLQSIKIACDEYREKRAITSVLNGVNNKKYTLNAIEAQFFNVVLVEGQSYIKQFFPELKNYKKEVEKTLNREEVLKLKQKLVNDAWTHWNGKSRKAKIESAIASSNYNGVFLDNFKEKVQKYDLEAYQHNILRIALRSYRKEIEHEPSILQMLSSLIAYDAAMMREVDKRI